MKEATKIENEKRLEEIKDILNSGKEISHDEEYALTEESLKIQTELGLLVD